MKLKIGFVSLGCAKNLVNSEQMMYLLREAGHEVIGDAEGCDAVVVNTCGFIESAKAEAIDVILELGRIKSEFRTGKIIVTGCLAQRYSEEILEELPEIDAVLGTGSYGDIVEIVERVTAGETAVSRFGDINALEKECGRVISTSPVWAYIKIAEGCDNHCAYCVIPSIRGRYRSRKFEDIIAEARTLAASGIKELIVVAQDITRYGTDLYGKRRLAELIEELSKIDGVEWIRLHYLYPDEIDDELISVIAENKKVLKYLDIPIQHINDGILKSMCRRSGGDDIRALFKKLRGQIDGLVLRTSLIAGLPGEGEAEFDELCTFLREAKIERAGVFPYSPEEGTKAAEMERVSRETAEHRAELVEEIQSRVMDEFNEKRLGTTVKVLVEGMDREYFYGRSFAESPDIDGRVLFTGSAVINEFCNVVITGTEDGEPVGHVV